MMVVAVLFLSMAEFGYTEEPVNPNTPLIPPPITDQNAPAGPYEIKKRIENVVKLRDPFKQPDLSNQMNAKKFGSDLEGFSVQEIKLVGVIVGTGSNRAIIKGPNDMNYYVKETDRVGPQNGVIVRIGANEIVIRERVMDVLGKTEEIVSVIKMASDKRLGSISQGGHL